MFFEISTGLLVALTWLVNFAAWSTMPLAQWYESKRGLIPERGSTIPGTRQKYLHLQDFASMTYGDLIGLALIQMAFVPHWGEGFQITTERGYSPWGVFILVSAIGCTACAAEYLRRRHKPDWGNRRPEVISIGGALHCLYFGINFAIGVVFAPLCLIVTEADAGWWIVYAAGALTWLTTMAVDAKRGHFKRIKTVHRRLSR